MKARRVLSADEKRSMDIEIRAQMKNYWEKNRVELESMILYQIHRKLKLGKKKLKEFYDDFDATFDELMERYDADTEEEQIWLCTYLLKRECGVDILEWEREKEKERKMRNVQSK